MQQTIDRLSGLGAALVAFVLSWTAMATDTQSIGSDALSYDSCRNVTFQVKNGRDVAITIKQIKYFDQSENKWQTESVKNDSERCGKGQICKIANEDLGGAEGTRLTKIVFVYKDLNSDITRETEEFVPMDPVCKREKIYGYKQGWQITGTNSTATSGAGSCRVQFNYTNGRDTRIVLTGVKYYFAGKWHTRSWGTASAFFGIKQTTPEPIYDWCDIGETCTKADNEAKFLGDPTDYPWYKLPDAQGVDITRILFLYKHELKDGNEKLSKELESQMFVPASPRCVDKKFYGLGQKWTITK